MNLSGIFDAVDASIESNESSGNYVTLYDGRVTQIKNGICYVNKNGSSVKCYAKNISNISVNNLVHVIEKNNAKTEKDRIILEGYSADSGSISVAWGDITGKPSTFAPSEHNHEITDINNLSSSLYNKVDVVSGKSLSTNDLTNDLKEKYDSAYSHSNSAHARTDATKTEVSTTNGNIKINGTDTTVYTLPSDVAKKTDIPDITSKVDKVSGKGLSTNDYTTTEKRKLSEISNGAEVNQNAFSNVVVGSTTVSADSKTDTLTLVQGDNITIIPDATNDKITIAATDTVYTHPSHTAYTTGLYKLVIDNLGHIESATAVTKSDITNLGIPASDTHVTVDSSLSSTSTNPVQNKIINSALSGKLSTTGTAVKAKADASGNTITSSYASSITVSDEGKMQLKSKSGTVLSEASVSVDDGITQELIDQSWDEIIGAPGVLQSSYVFDTTAPSTKTKNMVFIKNNTGGTS